MALINIPRDKDDPNYRYKMPRLYSKIEGRGNGIKTNISNMGEIAKALKRPPMYPTKFFGCELGAQCKYEEAEEKSLLNGAHGQESLVEILDKFITMYVLCPGCQLPEIDMVVKRGVLSCKCNACGYQGVLDMTHKSATYMIRNPPDQATSTVGSKKKTKEERRAQKQARQQNKDVENGPPSEDDDDEAEKKKKKRDKKEKKKDKEEKAEKGEKKGKKKSRDVSEDGSGADKSSDADRTPNASSNGVTDCATNNGSTAGEGEVKEKEKKRKSKDSAKEGEHLMVNEKLNYQSAELEDIAARLVQFIETHEPVDPDDFFQEVRVLQLSQSFDSKCRLYVVLEALFKDHLTPTALEAKMAFIKKVIDSSMKATDILDALDHYCHEKSPSTLSHYPYITQKLYNEDILDGEDLLAYYRRDRDQPVFNKVKKMVEPFLQWLEENDSEESGDDSE